MTPETRHIVASVCGALDKVIPDEFDRIKQTWTREREHVTQTIRLQRMRNSLGLPWVTLTVYLDVHPTGVDPTLGLYPQFRNVAGRQGRVDGFGCNFRLDDDAGEISAKAQSMRNEMPRCLDYLDSTFSQDAYLAELPAGWYPRKLEMLLAFERTDDIAACLEEMDWAPRPDLGAADWYGNLELAETVLHAFTFIDRAPSRRWIDMIEATLASIGGRPSKANVVRHQRVVGLLASVRR